MFAQHKEEGEDGGGGGGAGGDVLRDITEFLNTPLGMS